VCLDGSCAWAVRPGGKRLELIPRARSSNPARQVPEIALFLRRAGANRIGARAFFTLEGYAGRNRETELALPAICGETPSHRPGSRLKLERMQTRSSNDRAFVRVRDRTGWRVTAPEAP